MDAYRDQGNIVRFRDTTSEFGVPQIIMEYCSLRDLQYQHWIRRLTNIEIAQVLLEGIEGLKYLHNAPGGPIAHRDLKAENILVTKREGGSIIIKLADFGCAGEGRIMTEGCGTPISHAPERWNGKPYSKAVDIWSFGVVTVGCIWDISEQEGSRGPKRRMVPSTC